MILVCPNCSSRFLVPATVFSSGPRQVRCARCSHNWLADLPAVEAETMRNLNAMGLSPHDLGIGSGTFTEPPAITPPIPVGSNVPALRPVRWWHNRRQIGWVAGAGLAAAILLWLIIDRQNIADQAPWMESFYGSIGMELPHVDEGLVLQQVHSERRYEDGTMRLIVEGEVHNNSPGILPVPDIEANALGPDGKSMRSWKIDAPAATLAAGALQPFRSSVITPEGNVAEINLSFSGSHHDHD